jgi:hypothetical protein
MVIDLYGLTLDKVRTTFPEVFQWISDRVKPERDQNRDAAIRENWWIFGRPRPELRAPLKGLKRFVATVETSKHRFFVLLDADILPDNKLVNFALEDAFYMGVLSSRIHLAWVAGNQSLLEDRPVYVKTMCFDPFPFPACSEEQKALIRSHAEELDAHRKRQQELFPKLTMTDIYNCFQQGLPVKQSKTAMAEGHGPLRSTVLLGSPCVEESLFDQARVPKHAPVVQHDIQHLAAVRPRVFDENPFKLRLRFPVLSLHFHGSVQETHFRNHFSSHPKSFLSGGQKPGSIGRLFATTCRGWNLGDFGGCPSHPVPGAFAHANFAAIFGHDSPLARRAAILQDQPSREVVPVASPAPAS